MYEILLLGIETDDKIVLLGRKQNKTTYRSIVCNRKWTSAYLKILFDEMVLQGDTM